MRIEVCVALLASTALHAGVLVLAPDPGAAGDAAAQASAQPQAITARLKNTLAARAPARPAPAHFQLVELPALSADDAGSGPRIDNPLRFYPPAAIAQGLEGEAILMLRFGSGGTLINAEVAKSSGHAILDEAALRAIRATPHFAAGPREMLFPVSFSLH